MTINFSFSDTAPDGYKIPICIYHVVPDSSSIQSVDLMDKIYLSETDNLTKDYLRVPADGYIVPILGEELTSSEIQSVFYDHAYDWAQGYTQYALTISSSTLNYSVNLMHASDQNTITVGHISGTVNLTLHYGSATELYSDIPYIKTSALPKPAPTFMVKSWYTDVDLRHEYGLNIIPPSTSQYFPTDGDLYADYTLDWAMFKVGYIFNQMLKVASGGRDFSDADNLIEYVNFTTNDISHSSGVIEVQDTNSQIIYALFVGDGVLLYTEAETVFLNPDSGGMFYNMTRLRSINFLSDSRIDTSLVATTTRQYNTSYPVGMFEKCTRLQSLNLESKSFKNIESMSLMFSDDRSLFELTLPTEDNITKCTDASEAFRLCENLTAIDLSMLDVDSSFVFDNIFVGCSNLTDIKTPIIEGGTFSRYTEFPCSPGGDFYFNYASDNNNDGYADSDTFYERITSQGHYRAGVTTSFVNEGSINRKVTLINSLVPKPTDPIKPDYTFDGWYSDESLETPFDFSTIITDNVDFSLYAKFKRNTFTVTFDSQEGSSVPPITDVAYGETITAPTAPTRTGYDFGGWYKEEGCITPWDFDNDAVYEDTTLFAKWTIQTFSVTFDSNGGSQVSPYTGVEYGSKINEPSTPEKLENNFDGWYKDSEFETAWDFNNDTVTEDITLYAEWVEWVKNRIYNPNAYSGEKLKLVTASKTRETFNVKRR